MGPDDSYMVQFSRDTKSFWADADSLSLGGCFQRAGGRTPPRVPVTEVILADRFSLLLNFQLWSLNAAMPELLSCRAQYNIRSSIQCS